MDANGNAVMAIVEAHPGLGWVAIVLLLWFMFNVAVAVWRTWVGRDE